MLPEGRYDLVTPSDAECAVLALHPHPYMGGDRFNPVVDAVFRAAVDRGWAAVRPDLSSSDLEVAGAEAAEALALLPDGPPVTVVGYSFGAAVACGMLDGRIARWVLVAPPFGALLGPDAPIAPDPRPKLLLVPAHDQLCPPACASAASAAWVGTDLVVLEGADHSLAGHAGHVARHVVDDLAAGRGD